MDKVGVWNVAKVQEGTTNTADFGVECKWETCLICIYYKWLTLI